MSSLHRWCALPALLGVARASLPPFSPEVRDSIWAQAKARVDSLPSSAYEGNQGYVCGAGNWGDGPQCNQWDQGHSPCWPSTMTISASWDVELMERWSVEIAEEFGIPGRGQLGPGVNVARFAWNGRLGEYMGGEDPYFAAAMSRAHVSAYRKVPHPPLQSVKHFIANSIENNRKGITEEADERTLFEVAYPPFEAAVNAGVSTVMCSYNLIKCTSGLCEGKKAYACANDDTLNKHLKGIMNFKGVVISDWDATHCMPGSEGSVGCNGAGGYLSNSAAAAAGLDLEMPSCQTFQGGVRGPRAKDIAIRTQFAYMVVGRQFNAQLAASASNFSVLAAVGDESAFCCWYPTPHSGGDVCASCVSKDFKASKDICVSGGTGTWCSGAPTPPPAPPPSSKCSINVGFDCAGPALSHSQASSAEDCCNKCTDDSACNAFTFKDSVCYLKASCSGLTPLSGSVAGNSAIKPGPSPAPPAPPPPSPPQPLPDMCPDEGGNNYNSQCKLTLARRIIAESTVVLKNEGNVLPLSVADQKITLVGSEACSSSPLAQGGGSGWNGFACNSVPKINVRDGIANLGGPRLNCAQGDAAADADIILVVVAAPKASEGTDRPSLQLSNEDTQLIKRQVATGKKVVVAMNAPGPMITSTWDSGVAAIVVSWLPGVENGNGIAMALYNHTFSASGRLPHTFPKCRTEACGLNDERASVALGDKIADGSYVVHSEKALIGYRWYHAKQVQVSYPFGFGLFAYGRGSVVYSSAKVDAKELKVTCSLKASVSGHEVAQLYLSMPASIPGDAASKPEWVLKGFQKVLLHPSESKEISFSLTERDLSYWDDRSGMSKWVRAAGTFRVCVGPNARDAISKEVGACASFSSMDAEPLVV
eukprot:TRINITY_DN1524_c0_g1_i2.p1 TRINITY_DN1524_c0_g1~~TRINITY_DN1524_c0_g1_i2.p1  ORF type:complete len:892 (-),score=131.80 TRINITY_DN1524_c0_g1_i2:200-2824(-)